MYIYEEYAKRINFNIDLMVRYNNRSVVFIYEKQKYLILNIYKKQNNSNPCKFLIQKSTPSSTHRGFEENHSLYLEYEDYENYINHNLRASNNSTTNPEEVFLIGWNFFLVCNDFAISENISYNFIYSTIDNSLSCESKIRNINEFVEFLQNEFSFLYFSWKQNFWENNINNYSYWLAKIINS